MQDRATERWWINISGNGAWTVDAPLYVNDQGPSLEEWAERMRVSLGQASIEARDGRLHIAGAGFTSIEGGHEREGPGYQEGYLDSRWSDGQEADSHGTTVSVGTSGDVRSVSLRLEAVSRWCSLEASASGGAPDDGPFNLTVTRAAGCE